jgi:hypothetical protein
MVNYCLPDKKHILYQLNFFNMAHLNHINEVVLVQDEIDILVSQLGTGNQRKAEVLFFGIEEGQGGLPLIDVVNERIHHFHNNNKPICRRGKKLDGHYYDDISCNPYPMRSPFLNYCSRVMLHLNFPSVNWSSPMGNNIISNTIREYHKWKLYREEYMIKSGLFEWKPMPRIDGNHWEYAPGILDRNQYENAFSFNNTDAYHSKLKERRRQILINLFRCSNAKKIISFGEKEIKQNILHNIDSNIPFDLIPCGNVEIYYANHNYRGRDIEFFLCPFPGDGYEGRLDLVSLSALLDIF